MKIPKTIACHYCNLKINNPMQIYHSYCHICNVHYIFDLDFGLIINIYTEINDKEYVLQLHPSHPTIPARIICQNVVILNLSCAPKINPKNIKEKLSLYLLFL